MNIKTYFMILCGFLITSSLFAEPKEILVSNQSQLNAAISGANPGDIILMKDGNWHNIVINFNSNSNPLKPITLKAQTSGKVVLDGNSMLMFSSPNLIVDGLIFKEGFLENGISVVNFNSDNCRLTNTAIIDYNPKDFETKYFWVYFTGSNNRMDHCFLQGKNNMNPVLQNGEENARYNQVDHCYIKDIPYVKNANGREIFRIFGYGHADQTGDDGAYFTIEYNLFDHAHGEGTEIVSLKSNFNIVRFNTVIASRGGLVGRRGKNNTFEGNYIFGQEQEGSTGIRVAGPNHRVINNYIEGVLEDGLRLISGEYFEKSLTANFAPKKKALPKYLQVQNGYFAHNTLINCGENGIDVGFSYKNQWPNLQMVLLPENNKIINNLVYNCKQNAVNIAVIDKNPPLDSFKFNPNYFDGNIIFGQNTSNTTLPMGIIVMDPLLKFGEDKLYHLTVKSPAINRGAASNVSDDIEGKPRVGLKDVGSFEYESSISMRRPLTSADVGPNWAIKL
jgi:poly(beta-D-mannuronate) lyase